MGIEPPFTYSSPSQYSFNGPTDRQFNPRAATQASWTPPAPKVKKDGPLVEFNRHPDSYLIVPYGNLTANPMPHSTRKKVVRLRQVQQALRFLELIGSCGMLFCVIAINKTSSSVGWIIRIAPAVALLHSFYGFYHFCRAATGRTAGSSASYMVFAAMMDTGLLPFFVFCALMSHADYSTNAYGWSTLFKTSTISYNIIYAFFLISVTVGGMLIVSLVLGVYLGLIFRKIAKLPPDMNPLEPTLTARPHKRNKSELVSEKHQSGATVISSDNLIAGTRRVPFMHTRTDSADSITLYNGSPRASRIDLNKEDLFRHSNLSAISRPTSAINPPPNARSAGAGLDQEHPPTSRASKASSWLSYLDYEGVPTPLSEEAEQTLSYEIAPPSASRSPSPKPHRESKNWFARSSARNSKVDLSQPALLSNPSAQNSFTNLSEPMPNSARPSMQEYRQTTYNALNGNAEQTYPQTQTQILPIPAPLHPFPNKIRSREPLAMNPPTPLRSSFPAPTDDSPATPATNRYPLHENANAAARPNQTSRPSSFVGTGGKARFYGDLRSSMGGGNYNGDVRGGEEEVQDASRVSSLSESDYSRTRTMETVSSANFQVYHPGDENVNVEQVPSKEWQDEEEEEEGNYITYTSPTNISPGRQISASTGYENPHNAGGYAGLGAEFGAGMGRRREVSGKVAEEGRGGGYGGGGREETHKVGAAGWARFKGL